MLIKYGHVTYQYMNFIVGPIKLLDPILVTGISFVFGSDTSDWTNKSLIVKTQKNMKIIRGKYRYSTIIPPKKHSNLTDSNKCFYHFKKQGLGSMWPTQKHCGTNENRETTDGETVTVTVKWDVIYA